MHMRAWDTEWPTVTVVCSQQNVYTFGKEMKWVRKQKLFSIEWILKSYAFCLTWVFQTHQPLQEAEQ